MDPGKLERAASSRGGTNERRSRTGTVASRGSDLLILGGFQGPKPIQLEHNRSF
jgi:hypothetical protein